MKMNATIVRLRHGGFKMRGELQPPPTTDDHNLRRVLVGSRLGIWLGLGLGIGIWIGLGS